MPILLPALTAAFAAFCVWLTVRIVNRGERWAKRLLALAVSLPVLYVASFGPACWLTPPRFYPSIGPATLAPRIYQPLAMIRKQGPSVFADALNWYATVGNDHSYLVMIPID